MARVKNPADRVTGNDYVAYLRVSTKDQVNTDYNPEGISIPAQREKVEERGQELNSRKASEFIDPGRSAKSIDQRLEFQQMIAYIREHPNVRYVIVYMLSRFARNRLDDAIMVATLEKLGVKLVSAVEKNIDDTPTGRMLHGMLAVINEYASSQSGADIAYKMEQKAKNGGTLGRAPVGYLNVIERGDGREIRTVIVDPERGPLIRLAFELYATGDYTLADLSDELYDRGLRMRTNGRYTQTQISISKLSDMLRDRYYIGFVRFKGQEYKGRHEHLIDDELFERVQDILESRSVADERRRVHHHYLKGSLFCGRCKHLSGTKSRMILSHAKNRHGNVYTYFFCTGRYSHTCELPYVNVGRLEEAVEDHYASVRFSPQFVADVRAHLAEAIGEEKASTKLLHQQLSPELRELDTRENNLLDLAADGTLPQAKIRSRLHDIERQRQRLKQRLSVTDDDLGEAARLIEVSLQLLADPQALYLRCNDEQRRMLNQAIFEGLYVEEDEDGVSGRLSLEHELKQPFARLHAVQQERTRRPADAASPSAEGSDGAQFARQRPRNDEAAISVDCVEAVPQNGESALPHQGKGAAMGTLDVLLGGIRLAVCSNSSSMVDLWGFEPQTPSMRTRCATGLRHRPLQRVKL